MYDLDLSPRAKRQLGHLLWSVRDKIEEEIDEIRLNPSQGEPLARDLTGQLRARIGVYRIVYKVYSKDKRILVTRIEHRETVYN